MKNDQKVEAPLGRSKKHNSLTGFTLIEMLISIAIIGLISGLVIVRFSAFDSSVLLKSAAYDVALALRDAQVYSVGVRASSLPGGNTFSYPYGVSFTPGSKTYIFFRNNDIATNPQYNPPTNPQNPVSGEDLPLNTYTIGGSIEITDVCVNTGGADNCEIDQLDLSFKRPEFTALINAGLGNTNISSAKIKLHSTRGNSGEVWVVEIGKLGHISVYKQP